MTPREEKTERKYVTTKIRSGDYLLPGNNGRSLFRITRAESPVNTWDLWQYIGDVNRLDADEVDEWSNWECVAQREPSRQAAMNEAVRLSP